MGGLYGAWLHLAGHQVTLVDISEAAVAAINQQGLCLEHFDGSTEQLHITATTDPASVGLVDLVIIQVKGRHTAAAVKAARPLVGPHTSVLTLQNGWGNIEKLKATFAPHQVLAGISLHSGGLLAPGHIKHSGIGNTIIGELDGERSPRVLEIAEILSASGPTTASPQILVDIWTKLALNCSCLPACALLRFRSGLMLEISESTALMQETVKEVIAVARAEGIPLNFTEVWQHIEHVVGNAKQVRASMLQDVENNRLTEIDTINGAVVESAARHGIPAPINHTLVRLIRAHDENVMRNRQK